MFGVGGAGECFWNFGEGGVAQPMGAIGECEFHGFGYHVVAESGIALVEFLEIEMLEDV